jgi:DNA anti-recombination protein RmuC
MLLTGCPGKTPAPRKPDTAKHPANKQWQADEIAKDPEGYMAWADERIASQIADRRTRLNSLTERLEQVKRKRQALKDSITNAGNIHDRMAKAMQKAEDEDRWPLVMGGRSFDRDKALAVIAQSRKFGDDRRSLEEAYDQAVGKLESGAGSFAREIEDLNRLREKLALDLERVRLSQGLEEVEKARKTGQEIAGFSKTLGTIADDSLQTSLPPEPDKTNVDDLLK